VRRFAHNHEATEDEFTEMAGKKPVRLGAVPSAARALPEAGPRQRILRLGQLAVDIQ
jgi:hypothetical protein